LNEQERRAHDRGILSFETDGRLNFSERAVLVVDVEAMRAPLDLLLALARQQKVRSRQDFDLALADQYLVFIEAARISPRAWPRDYW